MNERIKALRKKHPRARVIFHHRKVPNGVNLYNRLKAEKLIFWHINYCIPRDDESSLLAIMTEMCGSDYPAEVHFPINLYAEPLPEPAPASPATVFTQALSFPPTTHVITYTPPSSPSPAPKVEHT